VSKASFVTCINSNVLPKLFDSPVDGKLSQITCSLSLATDYNCGKKLSINRIKKLKLKQNNFTDFAYQVCITLTARTTKFTQMFSKHYNVKLLNVQNHYAVSRL